MKNLLLISALVLTACSSSFPTSDPTPAGLQLDNICVKEAKRPRFKPFVPALVKSLENKGFKTSVHIETAPLSCKYLITYSVRNSGAVIEQANVRLHERESASSFDSIGNVGYKNRSSEEQEFARQNGVQGQTDRIVAELFKHY